MERSGEQGPRPGDDGPPGTSARGEDPPGASAGGDRPPEDPESDQEGEGTADRHRAGADDRQVRVGNVRPVDLRDYARFDPDHAARVRVLATDVLTVDLWCLEPHQSTEAMHHEEVDVAYTVLGGTAWFITDEGEIGLGPLGAMLVPAGVVHGIDNRTVDPVVVLASASPPDVPVAEITVDEPLEDAGDAVWLPGDRRGLLGRLKGLFGSAE